MNAFVSSLTAQFARLGLVSPGADPLSISQVLQHESMRVLDVFSAAGPSVAERTQALTSLVLLQPEVPDEVRVAIDTHWTQRQTGMTISLDGILKPIADRFIDAGLRTFSSSPAQGGRFLLRSVLPEPEDVGRIGIPEDVSEEARAMGRAIRAFFDGRIVPYRRDIESKDYALQVDRLREAADLGILGAEIPEKFGGLGINTEMWTAMMEAMGYGVDSFTVGITGHMGIGTHPIIKYGSEELKERYLPKMALGTWIGAYALTEPNAGSDALGGMRTAATRSEDGQHWILNGSKCFITNAGFADVFTVFAKVDGKPSAFVVNRDAAGFSIVGEEHKLGLKGSSTCTLHFDNVTIPVGNLLGDIGQGAKIALNILNTGRLRLGIINTGSAMKVVGLAAQYAATRQQFHRPIAAFGAVQDDLALAAVRTFVSQSMTHRITRDIGNRIQEISEGGTTDDQAVRTRVAEEFSIESSIAKIFGSETYNLVADRFVQIMGGYGYIESEDGRESAASLYRDARINELFEGTNGINRVHQVTGALLRRMKEKLIPTSSASADDVRMRLGYGDSKVEGHPLGDAVRRANRVLEMTGYLFNAVLGNPALLDLAANPRNPQSNDLGQHIALGLSELAIASYAMSSAVLRAMKLLNSREGETTQVAAAMARLFAHEEFCRASGIARDLVDQLTDLHPSLSDEAKTILKLCDDDSRLNVGRERRDIANHFVKAGQYDLRKS